VDDTPARRAYSIGHDLGAQAVRQLEADGVAVDPAELLRGFSDAVSGIDPAIAAPEMQAIRARLEREVATRLATERLETDPVFRALAVYNRQRSIAFHEENGAREGVETAPNGLQLEVLAPGAGPTPDDRDTVVVSFTASLMDGAIIASGANEEVKLDGVIEGARLALTRMRPGARWRIALPPDLAYGIGGRAPDIGPNESIVIDATLHSIR
jgi:FKBP-type peptidyl-prolyl cis-trans isomerase FklB